MSNTTTRKITAAQKLIAAKYMALKAEESRIKKELDALRPDIQAALDSHNGVLQTEDGRRLEYSTTTKVEYDAPKFSVTFPQLWSMVATVDAAKVRQARDLGLVTDEQLAPVVAETKTEKRILIKKS